MVLDLYYRGPLTPVRIEHLDYEIFELDREVFISDFLPIFLDLLIHNHFVKVIISVSLLERKYSFDNNEKDHSRWKYVYLFSFVSFTFSDFRGHVGLRSFIWGEIIDVAESWEAEVSYFDVQLRIYEYIIKLEIAMGNSFCLNILKKVNNLHKEKPPSIFTHLSDALANIEKESAWDVF